MTKMLLTTTVLAGLLLAGVGWAGAQSPAVGHAGHDHTAPAKAVPVKGAPNAAQAGGTAKPAGGMGMMGGSGMCSMMGGTGMGGMNHLGGMMNMGGPGTEVAVKNTDKGVTITLTATDPAKVVRLQKMAEAMRLMHEATAP